MKTTLNVIGAVIAVAGLAACTTPQSPNQLSQKTVNYQCGPGGQSPLTVQYTFQGRDALSARIIYQNQVVLLPRSTASNVDVVGNTFRSEHYTWITDAFDYDTVDTARGDILMREIEASANQVVPHSTTTFPPATGTVPAAGTTTVPSMAPGSEVSNIIVRDCAPVTTMIS